MNWLYLLNILRAKIHGGAHFLRIDQDLESVPIRKRCILYRCVCAGILICTNEEKDLDTYSQLLAKYRSSKQNVELFTIETNQE